MEAKTNWLAIITSIVVSMVIGFLWYGMLFQELWMAGNGITMEGEKMFKNGTEIPMTPTPMVVNVVSMFVYALLFNWLLKRLNVSTWQGGATFGATIGLIMLLGVITGNLFAANPISLSMVDGSYSFVMFTLMGAIIGGWRKK
jgi:hypothetical protein